MIYLHKLSKYSSETSLGIVIRGLPLQEKEYDEFRFKLEDGDWIYLQPKGKEEYNSPVCIFNDLAHDTLYKINAEYKLNNEWFAVPERTFVTQEKEDSNYIPVCGGIINPNRNGGI